LQRRAMTEPAEPTTVDMSPATAAALVRCGGDLYVWADAAGFVYGAGLIQARTDPPAHAALYNTIDGEGWGPPCRSRDRTAAALGY